MAHFLFCFLFFFKNSSRYYNKYLVLKGGHGSATLTQTSFIHEFGVWVYLKKDLNTKRFKQLLIYFDMDTQYAHFGGNLLCHSVSDFCV